MSSSESSLEERKDFFNKELADELRRVQNYVSHEPTLERKTYYFSAAYGITGRTFRYSFSKNVLLADFILTQVYNQLVQAIGQMKAGNPSIRLSEEHFEKICDLLGSLADKFESKDDNIQSQLEDLLTIGFSTTGVGNYLAEKGDLKI
jgi:hypothetical protein